MHPDLTYQPRRSTQITEASPQEVTAKKVHDRTEAVRRALLETSERGFSSRVCDLMDWRKERMSRESNGAERLSVELVFAAAVLHEEEGRPNDAAKILSAFQRRLCPVIRMRDGQFLLEFE